MSLASRIGRWIGVGMLLWLLSAGQPPISGEELYSSIQSAFLGENFSRVVELSAPLFAAAEPTPIVWPAETGKTMRIWLWYLLSLDRLQRSSDALREIDHFKQALEMPPRDSASHRALADTLWPEVLFWEGEISRKALSLVRARLAYQRVISEFELSSWRPRAQLGLGLVEFSHQDYAEAGEQFRRVAFGAPSAWLASEARLLEALCDLRLKRFAEAVVLFKQLLQQASDATMRAQLLFYLGEAMTGLRRFDEAIELYHQAVKADPHSRWAPLASFGMGWSYFQQHRCHESLQAMGQYLSAVPAIEADLTQNASESPVDALYAEGRCLVELGDDATATARLQELRRLDPEHPLATEAALSIAEILERQGRVAEAIAMLDEILRQAFEPAQVSRAQLRLGSVSLAQGDAAQAMAHFQLARTAEDVSVRQSAINGMADAHVLVGQMKEAAGYYEEAMRLSPLSQAGLYATYGLGRLRLQSGQTDEAIELFRKLSSIPEASIGTEQDERQGLASDGRLALAFAYLSHHQPELARVQLERVRRERPSGAHAARAGYYLALLAVDEGDVQAARQFCQEVIERVPQSNEALEARLLLGDLVAGQAPPRDAFEAVRRSFASLEDLPPAHRGRVARKLADLARSAGLFAEAIRWYEAAWELMPEQRGELAYRLSSCYEEGGDLTLAVARYEHIQESPWNVRGWLSAAKLLERQARWQEARAVYESLSRESAPEAKIAHERFMALKNNGTSSHDP